MIFIIIIYSNFLYYVRSYSILKLENYQKYSFFLGSYNNYVYEFNTSSYFKDKNNTINIIFLDISCTGFAYLHVYYNKSKISVDKDKVYNSDLNFRLLNYYNEIQFSSNNCSMIYIVMVDQGKDSTKGSFLIINSNSYSNFDSNFNFASFVIRERKTNIYTFSFFIKSEEDYFYYNYNYYNPNNVKHEISTIIMDKDKNILNKENELTKCISLKNYTNKGIKQFFIKIIYTSTNFRFELHYASYNLYTSLTRNNYKIIFPLTINSEYFFYINATEAYDNRIYFEVNNNSLKDIAYIYYFNTIDIEEIKNNLFIKKYDRTSSSYYKEIYEVYIPPNTLSLIVKIYPKANINNFYFKTIYHNFEYIKSFHDFIFINSGNYYVLKYNDTYNYNKSNNGIISIVLTNGDDDCYINIYSEINDIYIEDICNKKGNLINNNYITFNNYPGDKYILVSNFKNKINRNNALKIIENMEYYNITNEINKDNSFSLAFKFNKTSKQIFTLLYSPSEDNYNYYLYFQIEPSNLDLKLKAFSDNEAINAEEDYFFKTNYKNMYFDLTISNKKKFSEFKFIVSKVKEIKFYQKKYFILYLIILIIIAVLILIIIILIIINKKKNHNDDNNEHKDKIEGILTREDENFDEAIVNDINVTPIDNFTGTNDKSSINNKIEEVKDYPAPSPF